MEEIKHDSVGIFPTTKRNKKSKSSLKIVNKSNNPLPEYATTGSSGMDVRACVINENFPADGADWDEVSKCIRIFPGGRALIHTGLYAELPEGYEIQIRPRSGMALKQGVTVLNTPGTIDADYRGELGIILINLSNEVVDIKNGDRIAQMVIQKVERLAIEEVEELDTTERGAGGFGHTGKE